MKLEKPLEEEEMDLLLEEIPSATSPPQHHHHHHRHHHHHHQAIPIMPHGPIISPYYTHHPLYAAAAYPSPDGSSSSSSSRSSSLNSDEANALDLLSRLHSLHLRPSPTACSSPFQSPFLRRCSQQSLQRQQPIRAHSPLYDSILSDPDTTLILDGSRPIGGAYNNLHYHGSGNNIKKRIDGPLMGSMKFDSLVEIPGYIYHCAKDQRGCRLLQKKFDEGRRQDVDRIFNGIIGHVADLMMNPFGNYLVQKLLDVCNEEQRMRIVLKLTQDPSEIIRVALNTHG